MFGPCAVGPAQRLLGAPPVLLQRLALPGEDRDTGRGLGRAVRADDDRGGGVVLGGEDVAAHPADLGAERDQGLDEHGGLDRHVQRAGDPGAAQRLASSAYSLRTAIRPGISCSASWISLRPNAASDRSATLKSPSATVRGRAPVERARVRRERAGHETPVGSRGLCCATTHPTRGAFRVSDAVVRGAEPHRRPPHAHSARGGGRRRTLRSTPTAPRIPPVWFPRA